MRNLFVIIWVLLLFPLQKSWGQSGGYDVYYEGTNDNYITFMQGFKENVDVHITYDGTGRKKVQVNGKELYMIKDGNITSYYYEDGEYLITLSGTEKESELIKMLKSLK